MSATSYPRRMPSPPSPFGVDPHDPLVQMAQADRADWALMRLVLCAALAILLLALASSLQAA